MRALESLATCAITVRSSPCSNLSNLCNVSSISFTPATFLKNVSSRIKRWVTHRRRRTHLFVLAIARIDSTSAMIFANRRYRRSRWVFCVGLEAGEEAFDSVKKLDERFESRDLRRYPSLPARVCYHNPTEISHHKTHDKKNTGSRKYDIDGGEYPKN